MHILLTNDDGIYADGIYAVYKELIKFADVSVVAPDSERSSIGHAITLSHPIWYKKVNRKDKFFGYGISGTPADCVKFAVSVLLKKKRPDFVVSGINIGQNDGCSVHYSGTVAGAREATLLGIPAMAVSLATYVNADFFSAAKWTAKLVKFFQKNRIPPGTFMNVNVPHCSMSSIKGCLFTRQGTVPIHGDFQHRKDPNLRDYYWMTGELPTYKNTNEIDTHALTNKYVTATPILCDLTNYPFLNSLKKLGLPK